MDVSKVLILLAIPMFVLGIAVELLMLRARRLPGYDARDSIASILTGVGNQVLNVPWVIAELAILVYLGGLVPWQLTGVAAWVVALIAVDFMDYWAHRAHHEIRVLWSVHVVHHSSEKYNLSVALRQPWVVVTVLPFLAPVVLLGIDAEIILASYAINLLYQFGLHTELINKMWRPIEFLFNTPSHHRVHHGSNDPYLDRNYGGILIVWDRMFGTFEPEGERVVYGLTKNIKTYNVGRIYTHEIVAIWHDVRVARTLRDAINHLLRRPGWRPAITRSCSTTGSSTSQPLTPLSRNSQPMPSDRSDRRPFVDRLRQVAGAELAP